MSFEADHLAGRVQQRPARVARVDRSVGLDRVRDRELVRRVDRAADRADDHPGVHRARQAERAADRDHAVADLHGVRIADRERVKLGSVDALNPDDRKVATGVRADERSPEP